jgi:hypothetical protein
VANHVPAQTAAAVSHEPPVGVLFAAFLGYNPMQKLLGPHTLAAMPHSAVATVTGKAFFPSLVSDAFIHGLRIAFTASLIMCLIAAWASWMRGGLVTDADAVADDETVLEEAQAVQETLVRA